MQCRTVFFEHVVVLWTKSFDLDTISRVETDPTCSSFNYFFLQGFPTRMVGTKRVNGRKVLGKQVPLRRSLRKVGRNLFHKFRTSNLKK